MLLSDPNLAYRSIRRQDVEGFERLLRLAIERDGSLVDEREVTPTGIVAGSLERLARITKASTNDRYRLEVYADEPYEGIALPMEFYAERPGDIYVFGPSAQLSVRLTEREGHNTYRETDTQAIAKPDAPLGFLYRLTDALYETVRGDLVMASSGRLRNIAKGVVRPKRNDARSYGELN